MVREKTAPTPKGIPTKVVRITLGSLSVLLLVVLTSAAGTPPNLVNTLAAQQKLVTDRPYDAEVHNDHGNLLVLAGRHQEAGDAYRRAIELAPATTLARYNLGVLLQQSGQWKQAQAEFQSLLEIEPRHARAHYQLGMLFHSRHQRSKAVEQYARAFAYDPELTFPNTNPHLIDNDLATEAILAARRYSDAPSTDMPRLYGEPERIIGLMLEEAEKASQTPSAQPLARAGDKKDRKKGERGGVTLGLEDDEDDEDEGEHDRRGSREAAESQSVRRALTNEDLDAGSAVGQVQQSSQSRSSAGRSSQGRGGMAAVRPRSRRDSGTKDTGRGSGAREDSGRRTMTGGSTGDSGRGQPQRAPRYRPASRFSTGRLELELLPAGPSAPRRDVATATR